MAKWRELRFEWSLFKETAEAWNAHNAQRLGASLAYYTIFSIAPLLLIFVSMAGFVFGQQAVRGEIYWQMRAVAGYQGAVFIQNILAGAHMHAKSGIIATAIGFTVLLLGASGVFVELRDALNLIWEVPAPQESALHGLIRYRLFSFALVIGSGLLITASLAFSIAIQAIEKYALGYFHIPGFVMESANFAVTFVAITVLFGLVYEFVPERRVPWTDVAVGSLITAVLFAVGKALVALYLGRAGVGSLYGAAGSLVVLLVWVYYSSQIFLFGAEFTHVYSRRHGVLRQERAAARSAKGPAVPIDTTLQASPR